MTFQVNMLYWSRWVGQCSYHFFGEVMFASRYCKYVSGVPDASFEDIGIGTRYTWHGMPDIRLNNYIDIVLTSGDLFTDKEESEEAVAENATPTSLILSSILIGRGKN